MEDVVDVLKWVGRVALFLSLFVVWMVPVWLAQLWGHVRCVNRSEVLAELRCGRAAAQRATCPNCKRRGLVWRREVWCEFLRASDDSAPESGHILHCPACRRESALSESSDGHVYKLTGYDHRKYVKRAARSSRAMAERRARRKAAAPDPTGI